MSYTKTTWVNGVTPINATNLNHIEDGIEGVETELDDKQSVYNLENDGEEIKLGYQIDGKDVYAKKISFTTPSTETDYTIALNITNLYKIIKIYGMIEDTTPIPYAIWFATTPYYTSFRMDNANVLYRGSPAYGNKTAYLVVEYTKSS